MRFTWNEAKNRRSQLKHKVSFETAARVFEDPGALSVQDRNVEGEERWQTLGLVGGVVVLLVAHTLSGGGAEEAVRIISARKATPGERQNYEQSQQKNP